MKVFLTIAILLVLAWCFWPHGSSSTASTPVDTRMRGVNAPDGSLRWVDTRTDRLLADAEVERRLASTPAVSAESDETAYVVADFPIPPAPPVPLDWRVPPNKRFRTSMVELVCIVGVVVLALILAALGFSGGSSSTATTYSYGPTGGYQGFLQTTYPSSSGPSSGGVDGGCLTILLLPFVGYGFYFVVTRLVFGHELMLWLWNHVPRWM